MNTVNGIREAFALFASAVAAGGALLILLCLAVTRGTSARHPLLAAAVAAVPAAVPSSIAALLLAILSGETVAILAGVTALGAAFLWRQVTVSPWQNTAKRAAEHAAVGQIAMAQAKARSSHNAGPELDRSGEVGRSFRLTMVNLLYTNQRCGDVSARLSEENADTVVTVETGRVMFEHLQQTSGWRAIAQGTGDRGGMVVIWTRRDDIAPSRHLTLADGALPSVTIELSGPAAVSSCPIRIVGVHLAAPTRPGHLRRWERELADLRNQGLAAAEHDPNSPWVLAGDFNASLAHPGFRGLSDVFVDGATDCGRPLIATWPIAAVNRGSGRRIPFFNLDHILISPCLQASDLSLARWPGTDHMALTATITTRT